ncbi:hypothetical protein P3T24_001750 [Paraburkholderia sp. GAS33]|uniref:hypothetical protein n=1 Tax=Paraburkholderia sp. GAS33 TaxID=3035130 RepID=UPI003D1EFC3A
MLKNQTRADATASTRAVIYQLCVAVDRCYALSSGQKILIERLGDVTIENQTQIEVKHYDLSDALTDGHPNFWNTLYNWMDDHFPLEDYASLILYTTQPISVHSQLLQWNDAPDADARLQLLTRINADFEDAYQKRCEKKTEAKPSDTLVCQRWLLDPVRRANLRSVIEKFHIEARSDALPALYEEIKRDRVRGLLENKDRYLQSLIGFVCRADLPETDAWEISYEQFEAKLGELNSIHCRGTRIFPARPTVGESNSERATRPDLFIRKIIEIQYDNVVTEAIRAYEETIQSMTQDFSVYQVERTRLEAYVDEVESNFLHRYRAACRGCGSNLISDSKSFYDERHAEKAPDFPGFENSPSWFRNGLLHIKMNDPKKPHQWKLQTE